MPQHVTTNPLNLASLVSFFSPFSFSKIVLLSVQLMNGFYCLYNQELIHVDYESEVEDDMLPIFRKGEVWTKINFFHSLFGQNANL